MTYTFIPVASLTFLVILSTKFGFGENIVRALLISVFFSYFFARSRNLTLTVLKILTLLMATLFVPIEPLFQCLIAGIVLFFVDKPAHEDHFEKMKSWVQRITPSLVAIQAIYLLIKNQMVYVIQFLTFGYDNAFHLSLFRQFNVAGYFPVPFSDAGWSDFSLFRNYPTGQAAIFSLFAKVLFGNPNALSEETASFFTLILVSFILSIFLGFRLTLVDSSITIINSVTSFLFLSVGSFVYLGIFVSNGFPPYLFGILVLLIYTIQNRNESLFTQAQKLGCTIFLLMLISPALIFFLIIPGLYLLNSLISELYISRDAWRFAKSVAVLLVLSVAAIAYSLETSSNLGWRQVYAGGGIQPPNLLAASLMLVASGYMFFRIVGLIRTNTFIQIFGSGTLSVALLSTITILFTGSIQYYAVKQFYVWAYLAVIFVCMSCNFRNKDSYIFKQSVFLLAASAICLSLINSKVFTGGFMGTTRNALLETFRVEAWDRQVVNAKSLLEIASNIDGEQGYCYVHVSANGESDLNSRWLNALDDDGLVTSKCFDVYWRSSLMSLDLAFQRAYESDVPVKVFVNEEQFIQLGRPAQSSVEILIVP